MGRNRRTGRRKPKPGVVLDQALADVREGKTPTLSGSRHLGLRSVVDPYDGQERRKVVALRDDPVGFMHARGNITDVQLKAARAYQADWEAVEIGGAKAIDTTKEAVDGGRFAEPDSERRLKAHAELNRIHAALGDYGRDLVGLVLAIGMPLGQVAQIWGVTEHHAYRSLRFRFVECLDTIAVQKSYAPARPSPGPKRLRDAFDVLSRYAGNPLLHRAVRIAQFA